MIKIAICDKDKNIRAYLSGLIREQDTGCEITEYISGSEFLDGYKEFDILFLDITLQSPGDGITLAADIRNRAGDKQPLIVFVTADEEYVYDAFDVKAFQYLLKPVDGQKFQEVFRRAVRQIISEQKGRKKPLMIQCAGANKAIPLDDIYYAESQGHKVVLHMKGKLLEYYAKIGALEKELCGQFFRIHKGYLVNLAFVDLYNKTAVTLTNGEKLLISKYKYAEFVKAYLGYVSGR